MGMRLEGLMVTLTVLELTNPLVTLARSHLQACLLKMSGKQAQVIA